MTSAGCLNYPCRTPRGCYCAASVASLKEIPVVFPIGFLERNQAQKCKKTPDFVGDPGWTRTSDLQLRRLLLYPLSYGAKAGPLVQLGLAATRKNEKPAAIYATVGSCQWPPGDSPKITVQITDSVPSRVFDRRAGGR